MLAASFKHNRQILAVMEAGSHEATISPELISRLADHPAVDRDIHAFREIWHSQYGTFHLKYEPEGRETGLRLYFAYHYLYTLDLFGVIAYNHL
ncbi:hypothetical protein PO124_21915 [Bacillus licheniformis]|nr:hypothetical protein [Bacillus licheniformis]